MPPSESVWRIICMDYILPYFEYCTDCTIMVVHYRNLLTQSMEQVPSWKDNQLSASQEIPRILWNPKVHYRIHKCSPPVPLLTQNDPVHAPHPTSWRSILILSSHLRLGLPSGLFPSVFPTKTVHASSLHHTCYMPRRSHSSRFDHPNNIWWRVQIIKLLIMYFSPLPWYLVPLRPKYSPQQPILKHPQPMFLPQCERQISYPSTKTRSCFQIDN